MHKIFKTTHGFLNSTPRSTKSLVPISSLHKLSQPQHSSSDHALISNKFERIGVNQSSIETIETADFGVQTEGETTLVVNVSHRWQEWVDLIEFMFTKGCFEGIGSIQSGLKESNYIRTACLKFARDRSSLIRYLSKKDIRVIAGCGCPSLDRKVVSSGKRLRVHMGIQEETVCSSCNLRGSCDRAYKIAREGGRTVDVMRILMTYGLDPLVSTVENKSSQNNLVTESVRRLLKEMVGYGMELDSDHSNAPLEKVWTSSSQEEADIKIPMKHGDWNCPKCNFFNFGRNIKCLSCNSFSEAMLEKFREDRNDLPLKKGDWMCDICYFFNFAKNTRCMRCQEKPRQRKLNPGEWECESCNYINFRKNMVCLKCDHRRNKTLNLPTVSGRPRNDSGGYSKGNVWRSIPCGKEAGRRKSLGRESEHSRGLNPDATNTWRFVAEEKDDQNGSLSADDDCMFVDFPIEGGKSSSSHSIEKRETLEKKKKENAERKRGNNDEANKSSAYIKRRSELLESTDDEEITDWFGHR